MPRGHLFPEIGPYETGYLPLSGGHVMYWEQAGNPNGRPVLFLHGGPGAGAGAVHRRFFDPNFWRIVIFDQRGAGRSRPLGGLDNNSTSTLSRTSRFCGAIWPSSVSCCLADHGDQPSPWLTPRPIPERVAGAVLRGVFLGRPRKWSGSCTECGWCFPKPTPLSPAFCQKRSGRTYWTHICGA